MMFNWFKVFNKTEFLALELGSKTYTFEVENIGEVSILVTKGNLISMTYKGVMLSLQLNDKNPFTKDGYGAFIDTDTQDVYWGIEIPDET